MKCMMNRDVKAVENYQIVTIVTIDGNHANKYNLILQTNQKHCVKSYSCKVLIESMKQTTIKIKYQITKR